MTCLKCRKEIKKQDFYGLHPSCFIDWLRLKEEQEFSDWDPKQPSPSFTDTPDTHYQGKYLKYSARIGPAKYILKLQEKDCPDLPAMEYLCNKIASLLRIKTPEYYLIKISEMGLKPKDKALSHSNRNPSQKNTAPVMAFVTKNFLQTQIGALHHIYKYLPKGKKHYNCEQIIKVIQKQTGKLKDAERFVEIALFDSFVGNNDRHGRNLGIIDTGKNKTLAPMYDNPSNLGLQQESLLKFDFNISGCIQTLSSKKPKMSDYIQEFKRLDFKKACMKFITKAEKSFPKIREEIKISWIGENRKKAFSRFLEKQLKEMRNTLHQ